MSVAVKRPKAILFDWDNTLVDNWLAITDALNVTLIAMGQEPWTKEQALSRVRKSLRDSFPEMFGERWEEAAKIFYDRFEEAHLEMLRPKEGAGEMLAALKEQGFYLAVVSNKTGGYLRKECAHLDWNGYFSQIVGATDAKQDKPDPEPLRQALNGSGFSLGEDVWYVGDADIDLECAHNGACVPVLIRDQAPKHGEFDAFQPSIYFKSCLDLLSLVRTL